MELLPLQERREPEEPVNEPVEGGKRRSRLRCVGYPILGIMVLIAVGLLASHQFGSESSGKVGRGRRELDDELADEDGEYKMKCIPRTTPCIDRISDEAKQQIEESCGYPGARSSTDRTNLTIANGELMDFGESPWTAALIQEKERKKIVLCTASVISKIHLTLSAHCFYNLTAKRMVTNLNEFKIYYGTHCALKINPLCPDDMAPEYRFEIRNVYLPSKFQYSALTDDFCVIQVTRPMPISNGAHPICFDKPRAKESKKDFIDRVCKKDEPFVQAGFSGILLDKPQTKAGRLRKFNSLYEDEGKDTVIFKTIPKSTKVPFTVGGDSGGSTSCNRKNENRRILIGVHMDVISEDEGIVRSVFLPQHQEVICLATNVCDPS